MNEYDEMLEGELNLDEAFSKLGIEKETISNALKMIEVFTLLTSEKGKQHG